MDKGVSPPTILVIFGISGDLSRRYLLPALSEIKRNGQIPEEFRLLGVSRRKISTKEIINQSEKNLLPLTDIIQMEPESFKSYKQLADAITKISASMGCQPQIIFYLVVPPAGVLPIIKNLGTAGLNSKEVKLLLEKPFGTDLSSAERLISEIEEYFAQDQVYRIDHYLAKGMAQNIAVFLGSNVLFRDVWHKEFISQVDIVATETIGIEQRKELWENTGLLRDFVQSHLLQLAALVLMEPCPHNFDFAQLPERRLAALSSILPVNKTPTQIFRGQYEGYKKEVGNPNSVVESFVALTLFSKDNRWQGVPIRIINGKRLNEKRTEIRIYFKKTAGAEANLLTLRLHPNEGIELDLWVRQPGYEHRLNKQSLRFLYENRFGRVPDAYEQVLVDAMNAKRSVFASSGEVLASWKILQPVLEQWSKDSSDLIIYQQGDSHELVLNRV